MRSISDPLPTPLPGEPLVLRSYAPCLACLVWITSLLAPVSLAADPPQPTGASAFHRSGQTFLTWNERSDLSGETYRVYRHDQPIDVVSLSQASLLAEVGEQSSDFHADRYQPNQSGQWQTRYFSRFIIQDGGSQLAAGRGLLVWTVEPSDFGGFENGNGYYAITTVDAQGNENVAAFGSGNTVGPVPEAVDDPLPVEAFRSADGLARVFIQYLDLRRFNPTFASPNPFNGYFGLSPSAPGVADSLQYAFAYSVVLPDPANCSGGVPHDLPVTLVLHGWSNNSQPPNTSPSTYCAIEIRPIDVGDSWWFGFARSHDYRRGGSVSSGDLVENYTEARVLRMVYDLMRHPTLGPRVDHDRIFLIGHSMGASGALAMSIRYGNVFAAAYCSEPISNFRTSGDGGGTDWRPDVAIKWGSISDNLPVIIRGPSGWALPLRDQIGTGVWDWQNHQANLEARPGETSVPVGIAYGRNDTVTEWSTQGSPAPGPANASGRCWALAVTDDGHTFQNFLGLPPTIGLRLDGPFFGLRARRDETVPGFSNASDNLPIPPTSTGGYNLSLDWSSSWKPWDGPPIDIDGAWGMSIRSLLFTSQRVDVTVRRPQRFQIGAPGSLYLWENRRVTDGTVIAAGRATVDQRGLLTVPGFFVSPLGNHLRIRPQVILGRAR